MVCCIGSFDAIVDLHSSASIRLLISRPQDQKPIEVVFSSTSTGVVSVRGPSLSLVNASSSQKITAHCHCIPLLLHFLLHDTLVTDNTPSASPMEESLLEIDDDNNALLENILNFQSGFTPRESELDALAMGTPELIDINTTLDLGTPGNLNGLDLLEMNGSPFEITTPGLLDLDAELTLDDDSTSMLDDMDLDNL